MPGNDAPPTSMSRRRKAVVLAGLGVFLAASGFDVVTGTEHWPFSPYAMYSEIKQDYDSTKYRLFAVDAAGEERIVDEADLSPFRHVSSHMAILRLSRGQGAGPGAVAPLVQRLANRVAARRDGVEVVRLYRLTWQMDPALANLDAPDERELILEVRPR